MGRDGTGHLSDLPARRKRQEHECRARRLAELRADPGHPMHGTMTGYRYGCRCERCRAARHEYHVRTYASRRRTA